MPTNTKLLNTFKILVLALTLSVGGQYALAAWLGPQQLPPLCASGQPGCDTPVNIGGTLQRKTGSFTFRAGGTEQDTYLATQFGNVGIGTDSPGAKLDISSGSPDETYLLGTASAGTAGTVFKINSTGGNANAGVFQLYRDGTIPAVKFNAYPFQDSFIYKLDSEGKDATGKFGIGTNAPASKLHIKEAKPTTNTTVRIDNSAVVGGYNAQLVFQNSVRQFSIDVGGQAQGIDNNGAFSIRDNTAGENRFVIKSNGDVGIGTVGPSTRLHVFGTNNQPLKVQSANNNARITFQDSSTLTTSGYSPPEIGSSKNDIVFYTNSVESFRMYGYGSGGGGSAPGQGDVDLAAPGRYCRGGECGYYGDVTANFYGPNGTACASLHLKISGGIITHAESTSC